MSDCFNSSRLVLLALLGTNATLVAAPNPERAKPEFFVPTTVGTKWLYQKGNEDYTETITESKPDRGRVVIKVEGRRADDRLFQTEWIVVAPDGLFRARPSDLKSDPAECFYRIPNRSGDSWGVTRATKDGIVANESWKVGGSSEISVAAGKFTAVEIEWTHVRAKDTLEVRYWYAEGVGLLKQSIHVGEKEWITLMELKKLTPGR
jgi:hypothetical protein